MSSGIASLGRSRRGAGDRRDHRRRWDGGGALLKSKSVARTAWAEERVGGRLAGGRSRRSGARGSGVLEFVAGPGLNRRGLRS